MRARLAASVFLASGLLLGSTGCAFFAPQATQIKYDPSDGTSTTVGDIEVRNAMAITGDGETVNLVMVVLNDGTTPLSVRFEYDFEDATSTKKSSKIVDIKAGESISFGNGADSPELVLDNANTQLGSLLPVFVQYGSKTGKTMLVPVLDNSLPAYGDLLPTSTPTENATPTPTGTPTETSSATPTPAP